MQTLCNNWSCRCGRNTLDLETGRILALSRVLQYSGGLGPRCYELDAVTRPGVRQARKTVGSNDGLNRKRLGNIIQIAEALGRELIKGYSGDIALEQQWKDFGASLSHPLQRSRTHRWPSQICLFKLSLLQLNSQPSK